MSRGYTQSQARVYSSNGMRDSMVTACATTQDHDQTHQSRLSDDARTLKQCAQAGRNRLRAEQECAACMACDPPPIAARVQKIRCREMVPVWEADAPTPPRPHRIGRRSHRDEYRRRRRGRRTRSQLSARQRASSRAPREAREKSWAILRSVHPDRNENPKGGG